MHKVLLATLIVLVLGFSLAFYIIGFKKTSPTKPSDLSLTKVIKNNELKVGSALEELPWGAIDTKTGKEIGAEVEIANLVAKNLGVNLKIINKGFDYLIPELLNKQYDVVIAGMSITDERKKLVNFTEPYLVTGLTIIVKNDNTTIKSVEDLSGKKVGTLSGTTSHEYLQTLSNVDIRIYDDPGEYIKDTVSGKIDATVYDATAAHEYLKENTSLKTVGPLLQTEAYGMAVRKEDLELLNKLNEVIYKIKLSSEFKQTISNWYGLTQ